MADGPGQQMPPRPLFNLLLKRSIKLEFKIKALGLCHHSPFTFAMPQWKCLDGPPYVAYRFAVATLLLTWLTCEVAFEVNRHVMKQPHLWFTYATEWAFILFTLTAIGFAAFSAHHAIHKVPNTVTVVNDPESRLLWLLFEISANTILTTSGIYWIAFWDPIYPTFFRLSSKLKHSVPAILVIVDVFISNMPIRLMHAVYPLVLGVFYGLFTYVYWLAGYIGLTGNGIIYPILNWNRPGYAIAACLLAMLFCVIIQVILYSMYFARTHLSYVLGGRGTETVKSLFAEGEAGDGDEDLLIGNEEADRLRDQPPSLPKTYASLE